MKLLVKCKCTDGLEIELDVRDRGDDEDIRDWMGVVTERVGQWHMFRDCPETKMEYLKFKVSDDKPLGVS